VLIEQGINAGIGSATAAVAVVLVAAPAVRAIYGPSLPYRTLGAVPLLIGVALAGILLCLLVASVVAGSATRSRPASVLRYE
jgi:hypothetical protein